MARGRIAPLPGKGSTAVSRNTDNYDDDRAYRAAQRTSELRKGEQKDRDKGAMDRLLADIRGRRDLQKDAADQALANRKDAANLAEERFLKYGFGREGGPK